MNCSALDSRHSSSPFEGLSEFFRNLQYAGTQGPGREILPQDLPDIVGLPFFQGSRFKRAGPLRRLRCHQMALVRLVVADFSGSADKETLARCTFDFQFSSCCHTRILSLMKDGSPGIQLFPGPLSSVFSPVPAVFPVFPCVVAGASVIVIFEPSMRGGTSRTATPSVATMIF